MSNILLPTLLLICLELHLGNGGRIAKGLSHGSETLNLSRRSVTYPSNEDGCESVSGHSWLSCIESSRCVNFSIKMKPCGWNGLEPKVCCTEKMPAPGRISMFPSCGIENVPSNSRLLRRKREDPGISSVSSTVVPIPSGYNVRGGSRPEVVGGEDFEPFTYPWMAALDKKISGTNYAFLCGASLISQRHILTAAHCFNKGDERFPENFRIRLGAHSRTGGTTHAIQEIAIHPYYDSRVNYNDIAVITLTNDVTFSNRVSPICLPDDETSAVRNLTNKMTYVLGWGRTAFSGQESRNLLQARVPVVDTSECNKAYRTVAGRSYPRGITDDLLCAGYAEGGKDSCQNDSGGPLQIRIGNRWALFPSVTVVRNPDFQVSIPECRVTCLGSTKSSTKLPRLFEEKKSSPSNFRREKKEILCIMHLIY